ncbi:hypothetical protein OIE62_05320 [Streptomyces scopuliridis]|uniref:Uncharacterized protein n=2 Tax=Streptomyces scopuliridis TaxID=452529 RepID=A0A2T7SNY9_9ACTN|nr:hypothetical protein [Streptomyces scopuliridis]PVE04484.1 hypothetical protein Y717_11775 [Streptomyces scopuliridis RB72]WSB37355.1 hypothetical protein OG949_33955 [Streptomyces scopuliridis]WSC01970.1 hypothetical protein OG835_36510 [Streptomyces scopuliridis]WSC04493.1 hypothetical protein OIE62_05320 [Streptomyces scopuliridis]
MNETSEDVVSAVDALIASTRTLERLVTSLPADEQCGGPGPRLRAELVELAETALRIMDELEESLDGARPQCSLADLVGSLRAADRLVVQLRDRTIDSVVSAVPVPDYPTA